MDEFENLGGAGLAAKLGAVSVDHAVKTSIDEIKSLGKSETVVVSLPCTPFGLAEPHYSPAKEMLAADCLLALATDLNPGTAWCESMQFVIALACRVFKTHPGAGAGSRYHQRSQSHRPGRHNRVDRDWQTG